MARTMRRTVVKKPKPSPLAEAMVKHDVKKRYAKPDVSNEEMLDIILHQFSKLNSAGLKQENADAGFKDYMDSVHIPPPNGIPRQFVGEPVRPTGIWPLVSVLAVHGDSIDNQVRRLSGFARRYGADIPDNVAETQSAQAPFTLREHLSLLSSEYARLYNRFQLLLDLMEEVEGQKDLPANNALGVSASSSR